MAESNLRPDMESQKRRSTRIVQAVPLTVTGVDALGRPFQERTSTLIINCHGCRYQSKHYVLKNMWVTFEVPHNEADREPRTVRARVSWIQRPRTVRELFQIGVELEVSGNVWGIAFPPGDWFPFPESSSSPEIPVPSENHVDESAAREWNSAMGQDRQEPEVVEDKVRVLPLPVGADPSLHLARQVARIVVEAKQQVQNTASESATRAVAAETRTLLAALQTQLKDAAEKSVQTAIAAHIEKIQQEAQQRIGAERDASVATMRAEISREVEDRIAQSRQQFNFQLAEAQGARKADFDRQIQDQLQRATEKLQVLGGSLDANTGEVRTAIEHLKKSSADAVAAEMERWQGLMNQRAADAQGRLALLEQAAKRLGDQISAATSISEAGWRGMLEADLAEATTRWNGKVEFSLEDAARRAAERLARDTEDSSKQIEHQLRQRINAIRDTFSQVTVEAESALGTLRASIGREASKGEATISRMQQSIEELEGRRLELSAQIDATLQDWTRRGEALLEGQSNEMNHRMESAVAGMGEKLQPMLETAGQQTIGRLAGELEQQLAPQLKLATEVLSKLNIDREQTEKSFAEHQARVWNLSEHSLQDTVARSKDLLTQVEKDFVESARTASARWLSDLEQKATETTHTTFEALFKSADWYEKKVQAQMQSALEKGLDQAAANLREKAGEISGLFASELDHYSRSYVEHSQSQMQENFQDASERTNLQIAQAAESAAANFTERATQLGREQFDQLQARANSVFEQTGDRIAEHAIEVRSQLETDAREFGAEFQRALSHQNEQSLAQGKQELASQVDLAKTSLRIEAESLSDQVKGSLQSFATRAMEDHKQHLETASNSWLLTTVTRLSQQSETLIEQLTASTEKRLNTVCGNVFAQMGETLRERLAGISAPLSTPATPGATSLPSKPPEGNPEEQR